MRSMTLWVKWLAMRSRGRLQSWCPLAASCSKSGSMQPARRDCTGSDRNCHRHWKHQLWKHQLWKHQLWKHQHWKHRRWKHRRWKQVDLGLQHSIRNCPHSCMTALAGFVEIGAPGFGARSLVDMPRYCSTQESFLAVRCSSRWASSCHLGFSFAAAEQIAVPVGFVGTERSWVYKKESPAVGFLVDQPRIGYCQPGFAVGFREDTVQDGRDRRSLSDCQSTDPRGWHCSRSLRPCCAKAQ